MWAMSPAASLFAKSVMSWDAVHDILLPQFPWIPHLIRHEVMHVLFGLRPQDERMTPLQEALTLQKQQQQQTWCNASVDQSANI